MAAKHDFFTLEPVEGGDPKATPAKAAKAPKTPRSRKKKADTEGEALEESPTKKAKTEDTTQLVDQNGDMNEVEGQNNGAKENEGWGVLTLPTDEL